MGSGVSSPGHGPLPGQRRAVQQFPRQRAAPLMEHGGGKAGGRGEEGEDAGTKESGKRQDGGWERGEEQREKE